MNTDFSALTGSSQPILDSIRAWFASDLGKHVLKTESAMLDQLLPGLFGYHLAQFSVQADALHETSPIQNKICINLDSVSGDGRRLVSNPSKLPFASDSIDVVLLHHLLDFAESPQNILRELARVTLPMGHIVIVGFNPISLWGAWRTVAQYKGEAPWNGAFIRPGRLMDWLNLLDFKIDRAQYSIYRPPLSDYLGEVDDFSYGVSRNLNLPVGAVYVIVARKHVGAVRPIKPIWSRQQGFGRLSVVRSVEHEGLTTVEHPPNSSGYLSKKDEF